jgi:hypothetical protein
MRRQQNVNLLQAGLLCDGEYALGVAIVRSSVRCVEQHGLAARRHNQRGSATLRVDPVDVQIRRRAQRAGEQCSGNKCPTSHGGSGQYHITRAAASRRT